MGKSIIGWTETKKNAKKKEFYIWNNISMIPYKGMQKFLLKYEYIWYF